MKHRTFARSLKDAFQGVFFVIRHERSMAFHLIAAALALAASLYCQIDRLELLFVFSAIFLVIIAEMFNTALEKLVDLQTREYHPTKIANQRPDNVRLFALQHTWFWKRLCNSWFSGALKVKSGSGHPVVQNYDTFLLFYDS